MTPPAFSMLVGLLLGGAAAIFDARSRKIPNGLSYGTLAGGVASQALIGPDWSFLVLWACLTVATITLFTRGSLGGGDVKMLAGLGLLLPPTVWWVALSAGAIVAGVHGLILAAGRERIHQLTAWLAVVLTEARRGRVAVPSPTATLPLMVYIEAASLGTGAMVGWP